MRKQYSPSLTTISISFIILWISTEVFNYTKNHGISFILYTTGAWALAYVSAIVYSKMIEFLSLFIVHVQKFVYAIILFPLAPTLYIFSQMSSITDYFSRELMEYEVFFNTLFKIDVYIITAVLAVLCVIFYSKKYNKALVNLPQSTTDTSPTHLNTILLESELLLGQGATIIDRVIKSLLYRANRSEKTAKLSLVLIVILVFIGGSISIGTIALDQFSKLRQLEKVRQEMLSVVDKLDLNKMRISYLNSKDSIERFTIKHDKDIARSIQESIIITFGSLEDTKNYKQLLENIQKKESYNISEIIMRVAIAALTFFLVQVFLKIYKYNQQQNTILLTKAEVLELFNEPGSDMKKLREILASKIEENPKFGNTPSTPIEQIINIADKAKSNGTP